MIELVIVGLIVGAASWSVAKRYFVPKTGGGCGSGSASACSSCQACNDPVPLEGKKVIRLRVER